jgi:hypothetical protein
LVKVAKSDEYDKFVCGSDQVWCSTTTYVDPLMYLRFAPKEKRIAYAPSIGRNYIPSYNRRQMQKYIKEIPFVSIREDDGKKLIKELTGRDVPVVLDPTLLLDRDTWKKVKNLEIKPEKPYILCYFLDLPSETIQKNIEKCAKENELNIIFLGRKLDSVTDTIRTFTPSCGPSEFISYIELADLVITDSYHGMLFSMIFEKRFWSVERSYQQFDQSSRQLTILKRLGLNNRYLRKSGEFSLEVIDYTIVNRRLDKLRMDSKEYLRNALEN